MRRSIFFLFHRRRYATSVARYHRFDPTSASTHTSARSPLAQRQAEIRFLGYLTAFSFTFAIQLMQFPLAIVRNRNINTNSNPIISEDSSSSPPSQDDLPQNLVSSFQPLINGCRLLSKPLLGRLPPHSLHHRNSHKQTRPYSTSAKANKSTILIPEPSVAAIRLAIKESYHLCRLRTLLQAPYDITVVEEVWACYRSVRNSEKQCIGNFELQRTMHYLARAFKEITAEQTIALNTAEQSLMAGIAEEINFVKSTFHERGQILLNDMVDLDIVLSHPEYGFSILDIPDYDSAVKSLEIVLGLDLQYEFEPSRSALRVEKMFSAVLEKLIHNNKKRLEDPMKLYEAFRQIRFPENLLRRALMPLSTMVINLMTNSKEVVALELLRDFRKAHQDSLPKDFGISIPADVSTLRDVRLIALDMLFSLVGDLGTGKDVLKLYDKVLKELPKTARHLRERALMRIVDAKFAGGKAAKNVQVIPNVTGPAHRRLLEFSLARALRNGSIDEAVEIYHQIGKFYNKYGLGVVTTLLSTLFRHRNVEGAMRLYNDALDAGVNPDLKLTTTLLKGLVLSKKSKTALQLFLEILDGTSSIRPAVRPDAALCTAVLEGVLPHLHSPERNAAFQQTLVLVKRKVVLADQRLFNILIRYYTQQRSYRRVGLLMTMMEESGMALDSAGISSVVLELVRDGRTKKALSIVNDSSLGSVLIGGKALNLLLNRFGVTGRRRYLKSLVTFVQTKLSGDRSLPSKNLKFFLRMLGALDARGFVKYAKNTAVLQLEKFAAEVRDLAGLPKLCFAIQKVIDLGLGHVDELVGIWKKTLDRVAGDVGEIAGLGLRLTKDSMRLNYGTRRAFSSKSGPRRRITRCSL
ncbi:hypothetical protein HDU97_001853 [Phlyctochytrium planicorne]|nr:hypothetical protein HDU97_001853 [Phlyctochytrium planicorne]